MKIKFLSALAAAVLLTVLIIQACRKTDNQTTTLTEKKFGISEAKEWWYGSFRKSVEYSKIDRTSPLAPPAGSSAKKYPGWKRAISYSIGRLQIVELPLVYETNSILLPGMQNLQNTAEGARIAKSAIHKLMLIKKADGTVAVRTVTIVPSPEYAKQMNYDMGHISPRKLPVDFSGYQMIGGWDESEKNILRISVGKPVKKLKIVTAETLAKQKASGNTLAREVCEDVWVANMVFVCAIAPSGDDLADEERCRDNGYWMEDGGQYELQCHDEPGDPFSDCVTYGGSSEECTCQVYGLGCEGDGGGGGGGGENPPAVPEIVNNVTDPCIKNNVNNVIGLDCKNEITSFINTTFSGSQQYHLQFFDQSTFVGQNPDDEARTSTGPIGSDITQTMTVIRFNNSQLANASQEYIAITILHEAIHAWIDYKFPSPIDNAHQHSLMAGTNRFNLMRSALMEMYPLMSMADATDLTWGGLHNTIEFSNLIPAEKARIIQTNLDYKSHAKGTPC